MIPRKPAGMIGKFWTGARLAAIVAPNGAHETPEPRQQ